MPSESYSPIFDTEIGVDKPLTASLVARMRDNPLAILKGSPSARAAGLGVFVQKDIGAGNQCGIQTDNMDTTAVLRPDGVGGVVWSSDTEMKFLSRMTPSGFVNVSAKNISAQTRTDMPPGYYISCGEVLRLEVSSTSIQMVIGNLDGPAKVFFFRLKRGSNFSDNSIILEGVDAGLLAFSDFLFGGVSGGNSQPGDLLYIMNYPFVPFPASISFCFATFP